MSKGLRVTKEGFSKLSEKREKLEAKLGEAQQRMGKAAGGGEGLWHDNAAFDQASQDVDRLTMLLSEVRKQLSTATIVNAKSSPENAVVIGTRVRVRIDGDEQVLSVLGDTEANPSKGTISCKSPIGKALIGAKEGNTVKAATPSGEVTVKILKVIQGKES